MKGYAVPNKSVTEEAFWKLLAFFEVTVNARGELGPPHRETFDCDSGIGLVGQLGVLGHPINRTKRLVSDIQAQVHVSKLPVNNCSWTRSALITALQTTEERRQTN